MVTFIKRFDFEHITEQSLNHFDKNNHLDVQVTLIPNNVTQVVFANTQMEIWQLIIQISKAFKMRRSEFRIMTNNGALDTNIYKDLIGSYLIKTVKIKRVDEKIFEKENPRRLIA